MTNADKVQAERLMPATVGRAVVNISWNLATGLTWHIARRTATGSTATLLDHPYPSQREARTAAWHLNHQHPRSTRRSA